MKIKRTTTKAKKIRKMFAVTMALVCTFAGVNLANADVDITNESGLNSFIVSGSGVGNLNESIVLTGDLSARPSSQTAAISLSGYGAERQVQGADLYRGFTFEEGTLASSIGGFVVGNMKGIDGAAIYNKGTIESIGAGFINNTSTGLGGAIFNDTNAIINDIGVGGMVGFNGNTAQYGGAIENWSRISTINAEFGFEGNSAVDAGAIGNFYNGTTHDNLYVGIDTITADFKNNTATGKGGAIANIAKASVNSGANVLVEIGSVDGEFTGNTAQNGNGGAILNQQHSVAGATTKAHIGTISGEFNNNSAENGVGGAIYNNGTIDTINANFGGYDNINTLSLGNTAQYGGAIHNAGEIGSISGDFERNTATANGGAILNEGTIDSIDGNFVRNTAQKGGAVRNAAIGTVAGTKTAKIGSINGDFIKNTATANGAAIHNVTKAEAAGANVTAEIDSISGVFENNKAQYGTIVNYQSAVEGATANAHIGTITARFENNKATKSAGAIYNNGTIDTINSDFVKNKARGNAGAILNEGTIDSISGSFTKNRARGQNEALGGAIYNNGQIGDVSADFTRNRVKSQNEAYGGAIFNEQNAEIGNITGDFTGNKAITKTSYGTSAGGAIFNDANGQIGNITGNFKKNSAISNSDAQGGAIFNNVNSHIGDIEGDFIRNSVKGGRVRGGAIANVGGIIGDITGNFRHNSAVSTDSYSDGGGAIANVGGQIGNITGNFRYNNATGSSFAKGGAIYNYDHTLIGDIQGDFVGNSISSSEGLAYGGAVYNYVNAQIGNITGNFKNNSANGVESVYGGAVYNSFTVSLGDITGNFISNSATSSASDARGGAIYNDGYSTIGNISGNFEGNYAVSNSVESDSSIALGGAIYNNYSFIGDITGDFTGNYATAENGTAQGGAIYNTYSINSISGIYTGNKVSGQTAAGGAISNEASAESAIIGDITADFTGNMASAVNDATADSYGGAIYNYAENAGVIASLGNITGDFTNNSATAQSDNSYALAYGGAIINSSANGATVTVGDINGNFTGNSLNVDPGYYSWAQGGAICNSAENGTASIGNITGNFSDNSITVLRGDAYGAAISSDASGQDTVVSVGNVTGNFENNTINLSSSAPIHTGGGAIFNWASDNSKATFGNIKGNFAGNSLTVVRSNDAESYSDNQSNAYGAAIYNFADNNGVAIINSISGDFSDNTITVTDNYNGSSVLVAGGAIANDAGADSVAAVGDINGNFTNNSINLAAANSTLSAFGGAIYNTGGIKNIGSKDNKATFVSNSVTVTNGAANGGAIFNNGKIGDINADFTSNTAKSGGAIVTGTNLSSAGTKSALVSSIAGDFTGNSATAGSGGAINNVAISSVADANTNTTIGEITGNFTGNSAVASSLLDGNGGAINNYSVSTMADAVAVASITSVNADFTSNTATAYGGAICNNRYEEANGALSVIGSIEGNFESNSASWGGAIANASEIGSINGDFTLNTASAGGAVYNSSNGSGEYTYKTAISSVVGNFTNNSATSGNGGAVYNVAMASDGADVTVYIDNVSGNFTGNTASSLGGAIYNHASSDNATANATITNISGKFAQNTAQAGGGIANGGTIENLNADFTGNYANTMGGGIYNIGTIADINGVFDANRAMIGGAIANIDENAVITNIVGSFNNNNALSGGAIANVNTISSIDADFTGNYANAMGGAIVNSGSIGQIGTELNYAAFTSNSVSSEALSVYGGAIYNMQDATIGNIYASFDNNYAEITGGATYSAYGGAIYNEGTIGNISGSFTGNSVTAGDAYGAAIYNAGDINGIITADFTNNSITATAGDGYGAAITNYGAINADITGDFTGNSITAVTNGGYGCAITNFGTITGDITGDFTNNSITALEKDTCGAAMYTYNTTITGDITGDFTGNSVTATAINRCAYGGALSIYHTTIDGSITGNFKNNSVTGHVFAYGGAIAAYGTTTIDALTANFENNTVTATNGEAWAGALALEGTVNNAITSNFINNGVIAGVSTSEGGAHGGALDDYSSSTAVFEGNTFSGNYAKSTDTVANHGAYGGAIISENGADLVLRSTSDKTLTFTENYAQADNSTAQGGAIYNLAGSEVTIKGAPGHNATFTGNYASGVTAEGGAIYNLGTVNIDNTSFVNNYVTDGSTKILNDIYNGGILKIKGFNTMTGGITGATGTTMIGNGTDTTVLGLANGATLTQGSVIIDNATIDLRNGGIDNIVINNLDTVLGMNNAYFKLDFDGSKDVNSNIDKITINNVCGDGIASLGIKAINMLNDTVADSTTATWISVGSGAPLIGTDTIKSATESYIYTFTSSTQTTGVLDVTRADASTVSLSDIISNPDYNTIASYSLTKDNTLTTALGQLSGEGREFTLFGNGYSVDANGQSGVTVSEGQMLALDNVTMKNFINSGLGGVISNSGSIFSLEADFTQNSATGGGAIYNNGVIGTVSGDFDSNTATGIGGAIYNEGSVDSIEGRFVRNTVATAEHVSGGGAVANVSYGTTAGTKTSKIGSVSGGFFENSARNGGAILNAALATADGADITAQIDSINGLFANNSAQYGGAINNYQRALNNGVAVANIGSVSAKFENNKATTSGGAIYNNGTMNISASAFEGNTSDYEGGAISMVGGQMSISDTEFNSNQAIYGGGIYLDDGVISTLAADFTGNHADEGGAVYVWNGSITDLDGTYSYNAATGSGGAINNYGNGTIDNLIATFSNNVAGNDGGAINNYNGTITTLNATFSNNTAGNDGGAINNYAGTITNLTAIFANNSAENNGGAVFNWNNIENLTGKFTGNTAANGGAVYNNGTINALTAEFVSNSATANGGAIYNISDMQRLSDSVFTSNTANNGGAVYNDLDLALETSAFNNNSATANGGALYLGSLSKTAVFNSEFTGNSAVNGGAIYTQNLADGAADNSGAKLNIRNTVFANNTATGDGGALYNSFYGAYAPNPDEPSQMVEKTMAIVSNSTFTGNTAVRGGAIYNAASGEADDTGNAATLALVDTSFYGNTATEYGGGAIFNAGKLIILAKNQDVVFNDNQAIYASDIYNKGRLVIGAAQGKSVTFNGSIGRFVDKGTIIIGSDLNENGNGSIIFNGLVDNQNITLKSDTLIIGSNGSLEGVGALELLGGTLNLKNGKADSIIANTITGSTNGDAVLNFEWADSVSTEDGSVMAGKVSLGSVLLDFETLTAETPLDSTNFKTLNFGDSTATTYSNEAKYVISQLHTEDDTNGYLHIDKTAYGAGETGLSQAIAATSGSGIITFQTSGNYTETNNLGTVNGDIAIVGENGGSTVIEAAGETPAVKGMTVNSGSNVGIKNLGIKNFLAANGDGGFADNSGTMTMSNVTFDSNYAAGLGGAIINRSEHTLTNSNVTYTGNTSGRSGGAVANEASTENANVIDNVVTYINNTAGLGGGAIGNYAFVDVTTNPSEPKELTATYTGTDVTFTGNSAKDGGAIYSGAETYTTYNSSAKINLNNASFYNNTATANGGAIYNDINSELTFEPADKYEFAGNKAGLNGGAIYNASSEDLVLLNSTFVNNEAKNGGAIYNTNAESIVAIVDTDVLGNKATNNGGAVYTTGDTVAFVSAMRDAAVIGNTANGEEQAVYFAGSGAKNLDLLTLQEGKTLIFDGAVVSEDASNVTVNINEVPSYAPSDASQGDIEGMVLLGNNYSLQDLNGDYIDATYNVVNGMVGIANEANFSGNGYNDLVLSNAVFNTQNNKTGVIALNSLHSDGGSWAFDITNSGNDQIMINEGSTGTLNITGINTSELANGVTEFDLLANGSQAVNFSLDPELQGAVLQDKILRRSVSVSGNKLTMNPCQGWGSYDSFNPAIVAGAVAQQGAFLTQINTYDQAFGSMDMMMNLSRADRMAYKYANRYASANEGVMTFSPNQVPEESAGLWFRPFASFEKVNMPHGPETENNTYGMMFGGDSGLIELSHGWDMTWGAYAGYTGSHQNYDGVSIYQNGGTLGLNAAWYKGNFFTGLTANIGASVAEADTMYGNENMTMLMTGIASKTGYNWEVFNSKLIVQPSLLLSYSFVNTFDYTSAAGVDMGSSPLNAIQIVPGIKLIGNLPHGWQPYLNVQMVWNIMDQAKFYANDVHLPQMSVDPYIQYGVGLQKRWGDRFTGFGQVMFRNGGRTGVALNAGFRWAIGKEYSKASKAHSDLPNRETKVTLSSMK